MPGRRSPVNRELPRGRLSPAPNDAVDAPGLDVDEATTHDSLLGALLACGEGEGRGDERSARVHSHEGSR